MKADFLFADVNRNIIIQKKNASKMHILWLKV